MKWKLLAFIQEAGFRHYPLLHPQGHLRHGLCAEWPFGKPLGLELPSFSCCPLQLPSLTGGQCQKAATEGFKCQLLCGFFYSAPGREHNFLFHLQHFAIQLCPKSLTATPPKTNLDLQPCHFVTLLKVCQLALMIVSKPN